MESIRTCDLRRLNSMTKYPSIDSYHEKDERGLLQERTVVIEPGSVLHVTEKIDGAGTRIIVGPGGWIIASRDELLYAKGDLIENNTQGIVGVLKPLAANIEDALADLGANDDAVHVIYGEVYGGNIGRSAKEYSSTGALGFRIFDAASIEAMLLEVVMQLDVERIAEWRDDPQGGIPFWHADKLEAFSGHVMIPRVPQLALINGQDMPTSIPATAVWLRSMLPLSAAALDPHCAAQPEGIAVRTADRSTICKLRLDDYTRALKRVIPPKQPVTADTF